MMSFCKNTLHTFLGFSPTSTHHHHDTTRPSSSTTNRNPLPSSSSTPTIAGLITITENSPRKPPANILESSTLKPSSSISTTTNNTVANQQDSSCSGSGLYGGLSSCTESLGLESSEQMEEMIHESSRSPKLRMNANTTTSSTIDCRKTKDGVNKMFPPLLSSLRRNDGQNSTCFLKPVRENGRLVLTQVTISRPEIFRASRQDGRLRLQFINQEESESESNQIDEEVEEEEKESFGGVEWKIPATASSCGGGGEGLKRCHEMNLHHHHHQNHHMQHWNRPQCVTSR